MRRGGGREEEEEEGIRVANVMQKTSADGRWVH